MGINFQNVEWYKRFKAGQDEIEDGSHSGRPSMSTTQENVEQVGNKICKDHGLHIRVVAEIVGIDKESVFASVSMSI